MERLDMGVSWAVSKRKFRLATGAEALWLAPVSGYFVSISFPFLVSLQTDEGRSVTPARVAAFFRKSLLFIILYFLFCFK